MKSQKQVFDEIEHRDGDDRTKKRYPRSWDDHRGGYKHEHTSKGCENDSEGEESREFGEPEHSGKQHQIFHFARDVESGYAAGRRYPAAKAEGQRKQYYIFFYYYFFFFFFFFLMRYPLSNFMTFCQVKKEVLGEVLIKAEEWRKKLFFFFFFFCVSVYFVLFFLENEGQIGIRFMSLLTLLVNGGVC